MATNVAVALVAWGCGWPEQDVQLTGAAFCFSRRVARGMHVNRGKPTVPRTLDGCIHLAKGSGAFDFAWQSFGERGRNPIGHRRCPCENTRSERKDGRLHRKSFR